MDKAQWSPINSDPTGGGAAFSPAAAKKQHPGLTRLPINFSNGLPVKAKKHQTESPKHTLDRPMLSGDLSASRTESRSSKPREVESAGTSTMNQTDPSTPPTTISPNEHTSERRVESNSHEMASNPRNSTSVPNSRAGTHTPKASYQAGVAVMMKNGQAQKPGQIQSAKDLYQALRIQPRGNDLVRSDEQSNVVEMSEPRQTPVKKTPGPRDTPTSFTKNPPNGATTKSHEGHVKPVQDRQSIEMDEQSSSSSDDDTTNLSHDVRRTAEVAIEEAESPVMDDASHIAPVNDLPDDHPVEWLAEARDVYRYALPPFVTKQKQGVRRMVELPLAEGQQSADRVEVVYRSWDAMHSFASIDKDGQRFIVKAFRGGATPYRPWLGAQTGFSEAALAFAKQGPRGPRSWAATQDKRLSLPKGWALREEGENDDEYSPGSRRKSAQMRGRRNLNYDLDDEEEDFGEAPDQGNPYQMPGTVYSENSSLGGDDAAPDPTGDRRPDSNISTPRPPSKLVNALTKSLRLPKEQDALPKSKQIKRRSIGGQRATPDSGANKPHKHKVDLSSESENPVPHKKAKAIPHRSLSTNIPHPKNVSQTPDHDPPTLEAPTLSPYKQTHTTLRIALVPYPQQSAIQRLRSCTTIASFFSTVIGVSGYKGKRDHIFGIAATFDCKAEDDADRSMVIREEYQDSFDIFLETVDGAESWTKDGGKCGVSVSLLLTEG